MNTNVKVDRLKGGLSKLAQAASARKDSVSGTIILVKPSDCFEEGNPRTEFDQALIESYAEDFLNPEVGQEEPIQLYPADNDGKYRVQHGASRLRAGLIAQNINPNFKLKAVVDETLATKDPLENFFLRGQNNIKRDNMTLLDRANFIGEYLDNAKKAGKSVTQADIAKRLGLKGGATYISRLLKLRNMTPEMEAIYSSGSIDDVEALSALADIQKDNTDLFNQLVSMPELDRATIRKAKKTGQLVQDNKQETKEPEAKQADEEFATGTETDNRPVDVSISDDESTITIPFVDYMFSTGRVNILVKPLKNGVVAALETIFEHGITVAVDFSRSPLFRTEDEAVDFAKEKIPAWAEKVVADKKAVSLEEYQDAANFLQWYKAASASGKDTPVASDGPKTKPAQLKAVIYVDVKGEEGLLLLKVPKDHIGSEIDNVNTNGFVYVQIGSEIRVVKEDELVIKSVSYRE